MRPMVFSKLWALHLIVALVHQASCWTEVTKPCPGPDGGCGPHGNCVPDGTCQCLWGWKGPTCEVAALGACRSSDSPMALPWPGMSYPKSCECYRQIRAAFCNEDFTNCQSTHTDQWGDIRCYERKGVAPELQWSDPPELGEDVTWYRGLSLGDPNFGVMEDGERPKGYAKYGRPLMRTGLVSLPLSKCPHRCHERGACLGKDDGGKIETGFCRCHKSFGGPHCNTSQPHFFGCLNNCTNAGECLAGSCKCQPGRFGLDCSGTKAFEPDPTPGADVYTRHKLRIYRYELPWTVTFPWIYDDCDEYTYDRLYSAFELFYSYLSNDTEVRTDNPYEANLFYIPLLAIYRNQNAGNTYEYTKKVVEYVRDTYPQFWNRNQGRDHFLWLPGDLGACWLLDEPHIQNPIKIVHFGLQVSKENYTIMPARDYVKKERTQPDYSCFKLEKDVVVPSYLDNRLHELTDAMHVYDHVKHNKSVNVTREFLLFFGGGIRNEQPEYSGGARQEFHKVLVEPGKHPEIKFGGGQQYYRESTFCLAPYGDGWGDRITHIAAAGCIPVIIQDFVHQPFDDVLPYHKFSVRVRITDIPHLVDILKRITPEEVRRYQKWLWRFHKAFMWLREYHGRAYEWTLESLHRKLYNLWGMHY